MIAGTIGAEDRFEYTVIGDAVNVAARLQEIAKQREHPLLATALTRELAEDAGFSTDLHALEPVGVRGRREPVPVVGMIETKDEGTERTKAEDVLRSLHPLSSSSITASNQSSPAPAGASMTSQSMRVCRSATMARASARKSRLISATMTAA